MPQNPTTQDLSLHTTPTPSQKLASAGKVLDAIRATQAQTGNTEGSQAAEIAFTNPDTSARYTVLAAKGLNNLRSELIAVCEFLPIGTGDISEDSAQLQFTLGDNNSISVNNIARIIELHRQIRSYILDASDQILTRVYPDLNEKAFLGALQDHIKSEFNSLASSTIDQTVENIFEDILARAPISLSTVIQNNQSNPFLLALIEYYVYDNVLEFVFIYLGTAATVDETLAGYWGVDKYSTIKSFNENTAINNTNLINLYSSLSSEYSDYSKNSLGGKSLYGFTTSNGATSNTDALCNAIAALASAMSFQDSSSVLRTLNRLPLSDSNLEKEKVKFGAVGDLASAISRVKNVNFAGMFASLPEGVAQDETDTSPNITYNSEYSLSTDTFESLFKGQTQSAGNVVNERYAGSELLSTVLYDMFTYDVCNMNNRSLTEGPVNVGDLMPSVGNFNMSSLENYSGFTGGTSNSLGGDQSQGPVADFDEGADREEQVSSEIAEQSQRGLLYFDFIRQILGVPDDAFKHPQQKIVTGPYTFERVKIPEVSDITSNNKGFGAFGTAIAGLRRQINDTGNSSQLTQGFYAPLESSTKELSSDNTSNAGVVNFPPATKYLVLDEITRSSAVAGSAIDFEELKIFTEEYKNQSNKLIECVNTLYPHEEIVEAMSNTNNPQLLSPMGVNSPVSAAEKLIERLVVDLENIIVGLTGESQYNYIPLLAVFTRDTNNSGARDMCLQVFWDQLLFNNPDPADRHYTDYNMGRSTEQLGPAQNFARLSLYHSENQFRNYLKYNCGLSSYTKGKNDSFYWGGKDLPIYLASNSQLFSNNDIKDKIKNRKTTSKRGRKLRSEAPGFESISFKGKRIDNAFEASFGNGNGMDGLQQGKGSGKSFGGGVTGFSKLFNNYFSYLLRGYLGPEGMTIGDSSDGYAAATSNFIANSKTSKKLFAVNSNNSLENNRFGNAAGIIDYGAHHRIIVGFRWLYDMINKTVDMQVKTQDTNFKIYFNRDQFKGLVDGLLEGAGKSLKHSSNTGNSEYDDARREGKSNASSLFEIIRTHQQFITDRASGFAAHADSLKASTENVFNVLEGRTFQGAEVVENSLAVNVLKDVGVFNSAVTLNNKTTVAQFASLKKRVFDLTPGNLFPTSLKYNLNKNKLMFKVLTEPGYGFLTSEKYGNKSILNIGIPNSMVSSLQKIAYDKTGDLNFLNSPYVCVSIFKKDHLNPTLDYLPRNFIFDTSANILDYEKPDKLAQHLESYHDNKSFDQILQSMHVFRYDITTSGELVTTQKKGHPSGIFNKQVMINHVHDYCLKEYMKLVLGVDVNEESFLLTDLLDFTNIQTTSFTGGVTGNDLVENFKQMLARIELLYPKVQSDEQLKGEVFRLSRMLKQSAPYSFVNRFKKVISPKSFDRVYSIFINENDFLIDLDPENTIDDLSNAYEGIFDQPVNVNVTSKISRPSNINLNPGQISNVLGAENYAEAVVDITNYALSAEENVPGVFQYKAQVSLLPLNFQIDGNTATNKTAPTLVQDTVDTSGPFRPSDTVVEDVKQKVPHKFTL